MKNSLNNLLKKGVFDRQIVKPLNKNNYANLFDVVNKGDQSYFNLCKGLEFENIDSIDPSLYSEYIITEDDSWTNISYKFYNTIELWWLICKFNHIKNPFKELIPGDVLKIPGTEIKNVVLETIAAL